MLLTPRNLEPMTQELAAMLSQHSRLRLEQYWKFAGKQAHESKKTCQLVPAARRPLICCEITRRSSMRIVTPVGILVVPATALTELDRPSELFLSPQQAIISCYGDSGYFRRWTFTANEQEICELETSPLLPVLQLKFDQYGSLVL
jgi:hypothetical protein